MVNITDTKLSDAPNPSNYDTLDRLEIIFNLQYDLMGKYEKIEERNGLLQTDLFPVNLHDKRGQARLKDFAWRVSEELGEALEAFVLHPDIPEHYNEEVADALHFLTEFTLLSGLSSTNLRQLIDPLLPKEYQIPIDDKLSLLYFFTGMEYKPFRDYNELTWATGRVVEKLALACNCLKNKPWKQSQMKTDVGKFQLKVLDIWVAFIGLCITADIPEEELFNLYLGKHSVNNFRIRSNY